ncbi:hypothetical protein [Heyndrickxia camelliae]|nr:hypothetical protein [Heyndrickxia camelliae]
MATIEAKITKTPSEAFMSIRNKVRSQMKKKNISYSQILKSINEKDNDR